MIKRLEAVVASHWFFSGSLRSRAFVTRLIMLAPRIIQFITSPLPWTSRLGGMASPANIASIMHHDLAREQEDISDYGSDFSPEEQEIVERLITERQIEVEVAVEDNPIVTEVEHYDAPRSLRLPRLLGREYQPSFQKYFTDSGKVAGHISRPVQTGNHADCE